MWSDGRVSRRSVDEQVLRGDCHTRELLRKQNEKACILMYRRHNALSEAVPGCLRVTG